MIPKFRAYLKNEIYEGFELYKKICAVHSIHLGTKKVIVSNGKYGNRSISFDDVDLMQSTGLFDKNGKEIFEGDVVESTWVDLQGKLYSKIGVVTYRDGYYSIKYPDDVEKYWWQALGAAIDPLILGNIHANPELLEDKP